MLKKNRNLLLNCGTAEVIFIDGHFRQNFEVAVETTELQLQMTEGGRFGSRKGRAKEEPPCVFEWGQRSIRE